MRRLPWHPALPVGAAATSAKRVVRRLRDPSLRGMLVYIIATGLAALLTLVLTRMLWRALSATDFGIWSLVDPILLPVASLVLFGIDHAIIKQSRMDHQSLRVVVGTLLASTLPASAACLLVIGLAATLLDLAWTHALLLTLAGEALFVMMQTASRATGAVYAYAAVLMSRNLLYLAVLLALRALDAHALLRIGDVFTARGGCVLLVGLVAVAAMRVRPQLDWSRYRDALSYGFPLLLTTFIYAVADMTDRWFLARFSGVVAVGIYALHLKLAAILSQAIVIPFGIWFAPERFRRMHNADAGSAFFIRTATALALVCGYLSGAVWLARDQLFAFLAPGSVAEPLVLACCLGGVCCLALSQALNVGLLLPGHTGKNAICTAVAVVATALSAAVLVPPTGVAGAAASRLVGGLVLVAGTAVWSRRICPVAFPFLGLCSFACVTSATAFVIDRLTGCFGWQGLSLAQLLWLGISCGLAPLLWRRANTAARAAGTVVPFA